MERNIITINENELTFEPGETILEVGGFDPSLFRGEDTELTYKVAKRYKIIYEPDAITWFRGSSNLKIASRKCLRHFIGVGQLFAKFGFDTAFIRLNLLLRGITLSFALASVFFTPWYIPVALCSILFLEFLYKTHKIYSQHHDTCVIYYTIFIEDS